MIKALSLCFLLTLAAASAMRLGAQSCFTFTDDYAVYTDESADAANIYTSVLVDGQGTMNITGGNGCSQINWSRAVHIPMAVNVISWGNSYVGGQQNGQAVCPNCYLSFANHQQVPAIPGVTYTFTSVGQVNCTFGGNIFALQGLEYFRFALTTYMIQQMWSDGTGANYTQHCFYNSIATCGEATYQGHHTGTYLVEYQLFNMPIPGLPNFGVCIPLSQFGGGPKYDSDWEHLPPCT